MTEEQIIARLQAARLDRPRQPAPPLKPEVKAQERWMKQPTEAVIQSATLGNDALARRMEQERKELAQGLRNFIGDDESLGEDTDCLIDSEPIRLTFRLSLASFKALDD